MNLRIPNWIILSNYFFFCRFFIDGCKNLWKKPLERHNKSESFCTSYDFSNGFFSSLAKYENTSTNVVRNVPTFLLLAVIQNHTSTALTVCANQKVKFRRSSHEKHSTANRKLKKGLNCIFHLRSLFLLSVQHKYCFFVG